MKKNSKVPLTKMGFLIAAISIIFLFPKISYSIDAKLVSMDKRPIFVRTIDIYKDGGTTVYQGINYQVIKWNKETVLVKADGKAEHGIELGYEISKYPNYREVSDGPSKELKFISH